jgi:hypothetical protein
MSDVDFEQAVIKHMVNRFLAWKLPADFNPDAGISFAPDYNVNTPRPMRHEPVGTNLLSAEQAEAMVRHMLEGAPKQAASEDTVAFVQEWMMSGDHEPSQWERDFAAAIDARAGDDLPLSPPPQQHNTSMQGDAGCSDT